MRFQQLSILVFLICILIEPALQGITLPVLVYIITCLLIITLNHLQNDQLVHWVKVKIWSNYIFIINSITESQSIPETSLIVTIAYHCVWSADLAMGLRWNRFGPWHGVISPVLRLQPLVSVCLVFRHYAVVVSSGRCKVSDAERWLLRGFHCADKNGGKEIQIKMKREPVQLNYIEIWQGGQEALSLRLTAVAFVFLVLALITVISQRHKKNKLNCIWRNYCILYCFNLWEVILSTAVGWRVTLQHLLMC